MLRNLLRGFTGRRLSRGNRNVYRRPLGGGMELLEQRRLLSISASVSSPDDNGGDDDDPTNNAVWVDTTQATFKIELTDDTYTVDDDSADDASNVDLYKNGTLLTGGGTHYSFSYSSANDEITLTSVGGNFGIGKYTINLEGVENSNSELMTPAEFRIQIGTIDNIILFIGDGMGTEHIDVLEAYQDAVVFFDNTANFPFTTSIDTDSDSGGATDSAAAATAMATGVSVSNGAISYEGGDLQTSLEIYQAAGKRTGLITSTFLSHATPAAFAAHNSDRNQYEAIKDDMLDTLPNVVMGGAWTFTEAEADDYYRNDGDPAVAETEAEMNDTDIIDPDEDELACGLFPENPTSGDKDDHHMPYMKEGMGVYPTLSEMTNVGRNLLDEDPDGFFLMVEGGRIDHASHMSNGNGGSDEDEKTDYMVQELDEFEAAVSSVYSWASSRTDTLIIVTADHETGNLAPFNPRTPDFDEWDDADWRSTGHTAANVDCFGWGVGAEALQGHDLFQNEHIFNLTTPDSTAPTASLTTPDDNGSGDLDAGSGEVIVHGAQSSFVIQLTDDSTGRGIDDDTVDAATLTVTKNGSLLSEGAGNDYTFAYNDQTDQITLTPVGGDFGHGCYDIVLNGGTNKITDYAVPAKELAQTTFTIGVGETIGGVLYIHGNSGADTLTVSGASSKVTLNGSNLPGPVNPSSVVFLWVYGHSGGDTITVTDVDSGHGFTSINSTLLYGGNDGDTITGRNGVDYVWGDAGNDSLVGGGGSDLYHFNSTGLGSDTINDSGGTADGLFFLGIGTAITINIGSTSSQTYASGQSLTLTSGSAIEKVYGSDSGDSITGNSQANYLHGHDGNDTIYGQGGGDTLVGDDGTDSLYGGSGGDSITAGADADIVFGDNGADTIYGEGGADYVEGGGEADCIFGGDQNDTLYGYDDVNYDNDGDSGNTIHGDAGDDYVHGASGADSLRGGTDDDWVEGDNGNDSIWGDDGHDYLNGGRGSDCVWGGDGNDAVDINWSYDSADYASGGAGTDTLRYNNADSYENDFEEYQYCGP